MIYTFSNCQGRGASCWNLVQNSKLERSGYKSTKALFVQWKPKENPSCCGPTLMIVLKQGNCLVRPLLAEETMNGALRSPGTPQGLIATFWLPTLG